MQKKKLIPEEKNPSQIKPEPLDEINDSDISSEEKELLERTEYSMAGEEDQSWEAAKLDNTDEGGDPLNETVEFSGDDLDLPQEDEKVSNDPGQEDEENDTYSLGGDLHDD